MNRSHARWLSLGAALLLAHCGPAVPATTAVATPCDPAAGARGGCPEGMACLTSTFFAMTQSFCYPADRPRCGGTSCCPADMRCYSRGFGLVEQGSLYCFTASEAARLCLHPSNHFVCSTTFGMLEPVPYSSSACPDPRSDAGPPPPRDASAIDVFTPPMDSGSRPDASVMDTGVRVDSGVRLDTGVMLDTGVTVDSGVTLETGVATDSGRDAEPSADAPICMVSATIRDCDSFIPCNQSTFMASCDDSKRLRYCEPPGGGGAATIRLQYCDGSDVCRSCRDAECAPGFESVCGAP